MPPGVPTTALPTMLSPGGPLVSASVHGEFGHVGVGTVTFTVAPTVVVCAASAASLGAALTVHVNVPLLAVAPALSRIVTVTGLNVCAPLVIVPVIRPLPSMLSVAGPLFKV